MQDNSKVFKSLKQKYNYLVNNGYEVVYLALQGSQNYGLDLYSDGYTSDVDCFAVVLPSFDDFVDLNHRISTTIVLENNEHINVKDIRSMFELYYKQNIQYLETLFTDYKIINKKYKPFISKLYSIRNEIANISNDLLLKSIFGMGEEKYHALHHPYPSIADKIEQFGYDGKQLSHLMRLYYFLRAFESGKSFKECLTDFSSSEKELIIAAKLNKFDLEKADSLAEFYYSELRARYMYYKENVWLSKKLNVNNETKNLVNDIKNDVIKFYFREQLLPDKSVEYKLCPDHYRNVFVTSDNHFGHVNILKYETKRMDLLDVNLTKEISNYIKEHNLSVDDNAQFNLAYDNVMKLLTVKHDDVMINRWNSVVGKDDLVIILGDFSFLSAQNTMVLLNKLNGDKVLVKGNHDIFIQDKEFDKTLFKGIYDYVETRYKGQELCLMHYPIQSFKHQDRENKCAVLLFGHIHSGKMTLPKHSFNVGVDVNNYAPVNIEIAIEQARYNDGGIINGR